MAAEVVLAWNSVGGVRITARNGEIRVGVSNVLGFLSKSIEESLFRLAFTEIRLAPTQIHTLASFLSPNSSDYCGIIATKSLPMADASCGPLSRFHHVDKSSGSPKFHLNSWLSMRFYVLTTKFSAVQSEKWRNCEICGSRWLFRSPKSKIRPLSAAPHSHCSRTTPITPKDLLFAFAAEKPRTGEFRFALCALNDMIPQLLRVDRSPFYFGVANKAFLLFPSIFAERRSTFCLNLESKLKQSYIRIHSNATNTGNCKLFSAFTCSENKAVCGDKPQRWI